MRSIANKQNMLRKRCSRFSSFCLFLSSQYNKNLLPDNCESKIEDVTVAMAANRQVYLKLGTQSWFSRGRHDMLIFVSVGAPCI